MNDIALNKNIADYSNKSFEINFAIIYIAEKVFYEDEKNNRIYICSILSEKCHVFKDKNFWENLFQFKMKAIIDKLADMELKEETKLKEKSNIKNKVLGVAAKFLNDIGGGANSSKNVKRINQIKEKKEKFESMNTVLAQLAQSAPDKGNECINIMKNCSKKHENEIDEINSNIQKIKDLSKNIEDYHNKIIKGLPEFFDEDSEEEKEKNEINIDDDTNDNKEIIIEDSLYENVDANETMKNDQKNIVIIQNLLENAEIKAKKDEEKREIIKLKNLLLDVQSQIEIELNNQGEQIDNIEDKVEQSLDTVKDANNDQLVKAAKSAVTRRRLAYQGVLAAVFCGIGTVVPGVGNVVGAALGGLIGYGIHRIDKHRLNKALKKYNKTKDKSKK